jgi:hypothetical protein
VLALVPFAGTPLVWAPRRRVSCDLRIAWYAAFLPACVGRFHERLIDNFVRPMLGVSSVARIGTLTVFLGVHRRNLGVRV